MFSPPVVAFAKKDDTAVCSTSCIVFSLVTAFCFLFLERRHARQRGPSVPSVLTLKLSAVAGKLSPQSWQTFSLICQSVGQC